MFEEDPNLAVLGCQEAGAARVAAIRVRHQVGRERVHSLLDIKRVQVAFVVVAVNKGGVGLAWVLLWGEWGMKKGGWVDGWMRMSEWVKDIHIQYKP